MTVTVLDGVDDETALDAETASTLILDFCSKNNLHVHKIVINTINKLTLEYSYLTWQFL